MSVAAALSVAASLLVGLGILPAPSAQAADTPSTFVSLAYARAFDTNSAGQAALAAGETRNVQILGVAGVPSSGVTAVVIDVAATASTVTTGSSAIQVWTTGTLRVDPAVLRVSKDTAPLSNTVVVSPDSAGRVSVYNSAGTTDLNIDVQGYFTSGANGGFHAMRQTVVDTTTNLGASGPLASGDIRDIQISGDSVPSGATAVFANVVTRGATFDGSLTFYPRGGAVPSAKSVNYSAGGDDATGLFIPLDSTGGFALRNQSSAGLVDVRIEIQGYFTPTTSSEGAFTPVGQAVLLDDVAVPAGQSVDVSVGGTNGAPLYGVEGAVVTIVARDYSADGTLKAYPGGGGPSDIASVKFDGAEASTNGVAATTIVPTGLDGKITIDNTSSASVRVKVALQGWFAGYRAIAASEEESFVSSAMSVGIREGIARLAVWNEAAAHSLPTSITASTSTVYSDDDWDGAETGTADEPNLDAETGPPAPPGADTSVFVADDSVTVDPPTYARDAHSQVCDGTYKLYFASKTYTEENYFGSDLWDVTLKKRWCGSKDNFAVGTWWARQTAHIYGIASSNWDDKGNVKADNDSGYLKYDGKHKKSAHYVQRTHQLTYCVIDLGPLQKVCDNVYVAQQITGDYKGGYQLWQDVR